MGDAHLSLRDVLWAFHSNSQVGRTLPCFNGKEILLDLIFRTYSKPMKWENAKDAGIFLWIRQQEVLVDPCCFSVLNDRKLPWNCLLAIIMLKQMTAIR